MNSLHDVRIHSLTSIALAVRTGLVLSFASCIALSQSAEIFKNNQPDQTSAKSGATKKDLPPPEPVDTLPSRFAGEDIEPYIAARAAVFFDAEPSDRPLGLFQDTNMKPVIRKVVSKLPSKRQAALPPTPLADIVKLIRVTTIMPTEKKFLVGGRTFNEGEEFPLVFQGKTMEMKVIEVTAKRILFRDLGKGEDAALETGMLPPGMVIAGGKDLKPPGMVSPVDDIPLRLDSGRSNNSTE